MQYQSQFWSFLLEILHQGKHSAFETSGESLCSCPVQGWLSQVVPLCYWSEPKLCSVQAYLLWKPACQAQACPHCSAPVAATSYSTPLILDINFRNVLSGHMITEVPYHYLLTVCLSLFSKLVFVTQHMLGKIPHPSTLPCLTTHKISVHKSIIMVVYSYAKKSSAILEYMYILSLVIPPFSPTVYIFSCSSDLYNHIGCGNVSWLCNPPPLHSSWVFLHILWKSVFNF